MVIEKKYQEMIQDELMESHRQIAGFSSIFEM